MPASRSRSFRSPGSPHPGAAAAPSALAVLASLRAVSLGRLSLLREGPRPGSPGPGRNFCLAVPGGHLGRAREGLTRRQGPAGGSTLRPQRRVPTPATATRPGPRSAESLPRVQRPLHPPAGPGRAGPELAGAPRPATSQIAARPGRTALQRQGRPGPLGDLASSSARGLAPSLSGADSGNSRENLHGSRGRVLPRAGTETPARDAPGRSPTRCLPDPALGSPRIRAPLTSAPPTTAGS